MSKLENGLLEGFSLIRSFINTFIALVVHPTKVLRSMEPGYNSSIKYLHPAIFFGISTFLSFILKVDSASNFFEISNLSTLVRTVPTFIHNSSFTDALLYISPIIIGSYITISLLVFITQVPQAYRIVFRNYAFYSFAMAQLLIFCVLLLQCIIDKVKPVRINDHHLFGPFELLEIYLFILSWIVAILLPLISIARVFSANKRTRVGIRFFIIPIMIPFFSMFTNKVNEITVSQRSEMYPKDELKYSFPSMIPDQNHISISFKKHSDFAYLTIYMMFYNPTTKVFFLPEHFSFSYHLKKTPNIEESLSFYAIKKDDTNIDNYSNDLLIRPSEIIEKKYATSISIKELENVEKCEHDTPQNNFHLDMSYYDFDGAQQYLGRNWKLLFYEQLTVDSTNKLMNVLLSRLIKGANKVDTTHLKLLQYK